jgi:hypothetical protein
MKHIVHVQGISSSKKLPHIPDTEKVDKITKNAISAVGATQPNFHDRVLVNLQLETLDGAEIYFTNR